MAIEITDEMVDKVEAVYQSHAGSDYSVRDVMFFILDAVVPLIEAQLNAEIERLQFELAEERAKHALTLMNYDQQSADLAQVRAAAPKAEA